jgi:aspartate aminotransferase
MSTAATPGLAEALARLGTESAFAVLGRAVELERRGRSVVHLEIGAPDFRTPRHVCDVAVEAIGAGHHAYGPSAGLPAFREAAAAYLSRSRGIPVEPERVVAANGAKPFLLWSVLATCDPGDEVVYPDPGFPIYESAIRFAGATPVPVPLVEERDFVLDLDELAERLSPRTRLVVLNSPHNPTGGALSAADLEEAARLILETGAWVLSDEVYSELLYEGEFASIAAVPGMAERTIVLDSLSKTFAMTGWRCGYAALPAPLVEPMVRLAVNTTSCVPPFVQLAGVAALTGPMDEPRAMLDEFRRRRDLVVRGLNELPGVTCRTPRGAFYAFPNVSGVPLPAEELADRLLEEAGVAVLAGSAFGRVGADNLRLSYANSQPNLELALERMRDFLDGL